MFEGIVQRYSHMRYHRTDLQNVPFAPQVLVPWAAVMAAHGEHDYLRARVLFHKTMLCLSQTYSKRQEEWASAPRPPEPQGPFDQGQLEESKWRARVASWEERRRQAAAGDLFSETELRLAEEAVRKFALSHALEEDGAITRALQRVVSDFPSTPMARFAQAHLTRGRIETMRPELPPAP
jgi:hypothetical protein